ncbi:MAG: transposase [Kiritimatiellae bacterium]|nr:transposase [Kiritimatiellia bacterium]
MLLPLVHNLHYSWSGWPSAAEFPLEPAAPFLDDLRAAWRRDGLELESRNWRPDVISMTFHAAPDASPVFITARVKGRIQHTLRRSGTPCDFSRKVALRSLGDNQSDVVGNYLREQTARADFADERYRATLREASLEDATVDLSAPAETNSGRYWYNLHLVAVTQDRVRVGREDFLYKIRDGVLAWAREMDCRLGSLALMPDHVHLAVRGALARSPMELAETLWRTLNRAAGCRLMSDKVYAGTFSEYSVKVVL